MLQVKRAGHSTLTTPDIGRMVDYFTRIVGLSLVARDKDRAILATKSGLEAIALERGDAGEAPRLSFQIAPGSDLDAIAARLTQAGLKSGRRHDRDAAQTRPHRLYLPRCRRHGEVLLRSPRFSRFRLA
jgi:catechol 2,3-dioxygenase-like lactoylglutathione lyase family enzyme